MTAQKKYLLIIILLFVGAAIYFLPSDEKQIRGHLDSLAEYCSSAQGEPVIETLKKATQAAKLCTAPCAVQIESVNIDRELSLKEISDHILMMKKRLVNTTFSFHDTSVVFPIDNFAEIVTTLRLNGETVGQQFTDAYEVKISVVKKDGSWLFSSFEVVEFMEKY